MATSDNGSSPTGRAKTEQRMNIPNQGPKRNRRKHNHSAQLDGSVSESNTPHSPRPINNQHQRHHTQPQHINYSQQGKHIDARQRPPSTSAHTGPGTPAKEQAYAGPTFQASPAASALPVPKFFSRSVPGSTPLQERLDAEQSPDPKRYPAPELLAPQAVPSRSSQASPLDMFFKADKAEKERTRSQGSSLSPDQPRHVHPVPSELSADSPRAFLGQNRPGPPQRIASADHPQHRYSNAQQEAATQSLKDLLFTKPSPTQPVQPTPPPQRHDGSRENPFLSTPSPSQRSTSGPSTPAPNSEQQRNNYALHYGNRNLSPLFMSARGETPPRPSGLRQEVPYHNLAPPHPSHFPPPQYSYPPQQPQHPDPNQFSREFLNQHIQGSRAGQFPPPAFPHGPHYAGAPPSASAPPPQHGVGGPGSVPPSKPPSSGDDKISSMEDDLRRMLKLNVVS